MDRVSEVLFGLIMVLTFTGSLSVAQAGRTEVRTMLLGTLGCNLAWGIIDGVFYLIGCLAEKSRLVITRDYVQPTVTADRKCLYLEVRYNYEGMDTGGRSCLSLRRSGFPSAWSRSGRERTRATATFSAGSCSASPISISRWISRPSCSTPQGQTDRRRGRRREFLSEDIFPRLPHREQVSTGPGEVRSGK